jgi:hypothetical protein
VSLRGGLLGMLLLLAAPASARESLRLPWVFSDEPDLCADFGFAPGQGGKTAVELVLGGRFAHFGLPHRAPRPPKLDIHCEFTAPSELERSAFTLDSKLDLADVLKEYGKPFTAAQFGSGSKLVYKSELKAELAPGDYNVRIVISDAALGLESRRTLHMIVPSLEAQAWQLDDLKFIVAVGQRLDEKGRVQRVLDPNPWRQVGGDLGWDLMLAYSDRGPRPGGRLLRTHRVRRLRGDEAVIWEQSGEAPKKKASQVWLLQVPEATVKAWKAGVYLLEVELQSGKQVIRSSKTFEVLP